MFTFSLSDDVSAAVWPPGSGATSGLSASCTCKRGAEVGAMGEGVILSAYAASTISVCHGELLRNAPLRAALECSLPVPETLQPGALALFAACHASIDGAAAIAYWSNTYRYRMLIDWSLHYRWPPCVQMLTPKALIRQRRAFVRHVLMTGRRRLWANYVNGVALDPDEGCGNVARWCETVLGLRFGASLAYFWAVEELEEVARRPHPFRAATKDVTATVARGMPMSW